MVLLLQSTKTKARRSINEGLIGPPPLATAFVSYDGDKGGVVVVVLWLLGDIMARMECEKEIRLC